jgi:hypothetical protein
MRWSNRQAGGGNFCAVGMSDAVLQGGFTDEME